jgi:rod shape-determining protein MreC
MANGAWKIARGRGNAQLPLVIVVALAVVLVLLGKAQSGLFDRARVHVTDWMYPMLERVRGPVQGFDRWVGSIAEIFSVYEENLKLKEENARLRQWHNAEIVLEGRVKHYQALLHAVPDPKLNAVLARVIGRASRPFLQTMILDAGISHNAHAGQAVIDATGMIGRIYLSGERTSWVILLTDLNSRIPVTIAPGNVQAILAGDNSPMPTLEQVSHTVTLKQGDQVVSSGDGGLLPPGLPIGSVMSDGKGGWRVVLLADASQTQDVEILNFAQPPEQLPATAQLPVEAAGLKPQATQAPPGTATPAPVKTTAKPPAKPAAKPVTASNTPAKPATPAPTPDDDTTTDQ